ncbi:MAG: RagB/SusD family nutrient uptake outer membrane protein [Odoribacter sp.]
MKRKLTYIVLLLTLCSSCSDWLDVRPRNEMKETDMYAVEEGFKNALTGAYIQLASQELYGKLASMYIPECLAQHWTFPTDKTTEMYNLGKYDYTHSKVEPVIERMWEKYYQCVVHLNNVLGNLKNTGVVFSYDNDKLIEGEALGLRALIHLELLRFFGPVPTVATSGDKAIPYVEAMTKDPDKLVTITYGEVLEKILRDLNAAEELLKIDPILRGSNAQLNNPMNTFFWLEHPEDKPLDEWQFYRQVRFNYYAVLGAKARYYHWIGDKENAVKYAKMVIEAENRDGTSKFSLADETYYSSGSDLVMRCEHLFGIQNPDLQMITLNLFKTEKTSLYQSVKNIKAAYESGVHPDDIRNIEKRYWEERTYQNSKKVHHFRKYTGNDNFKQLNLVPILRLSEMYLILTEDLPLSEVKSYFSTYRISRNLDKSIEDKLSSEDAILQILEKEYRKEFYGEGQMFFFYKRHNYKAFTWPKKLKLPADAYQIPLPKSQSVFD